VCSGRSPAATPDRIADVDLLVFTGDPLSLFEQAALRNDLEDLLGCPVHVLTTSGLHAAYCCRSLLPARRSSVNAFSVLASLIRAAR
jgi:predicted nucleotidyltransferase